MKKTRQQTYDFLHRLFLFSFSLCLFVSVVNSYPAALHGLDAYRTIRDAD